MAKEALQRIEKKKRDRIFRNAAAEFARHGYHKANINSIAKRAGIGKGSIYLYFKDKRDLYYSTFVEAAGMQNEIFDSIEETDLEPMRKVERVFEESARVFPRYRNMFKMYSDLTSSGNDKSAADLAQILEKRSAAFFRKVLREGIDSGSMRKDLSVTHAAYFIDSVYTVFFMTLASSYQRERFRVFTNSDLSKNDRLVKRHIREILNMLEQGIGATGSATSSRTKGNARRKSAAKRKPGPK